CGCFYCVGIFKSAEIIEWTDEDNPKGQTALCPICGIDSVIGDKSNFPITDKNFLNQMHSFYF
ncbi:MAG TPA: cytoplasmic protein, partial [Chitinophagaceae bacterium]